MRGPHCISGCPCHHTSYATTEEEKREGLGRGSGMLLAHSLVPHSSFTTEEESWQGDPVLLHDATQGYGLYHVSVGSEPAVGFWDWAEYLSIYVWVHLCVVCVYVCAPSVTQNARGTPNHPVCHPVPYSFYPFLSSVSLSPLLWFCHLAPLKRPLTEVLRQTGLCGVNGAHCKRFCDIFAGK